MSVGTKPGDDCNRVPEPDEDQPRNYRPKPCRGVMGHVDDDEDEPITCDVCGEEA